MNARTWKRLVAGGTLAGTVALAGCGTIKTTVYDYDKQTGIREPQRCFKGLPVTLEVPTFLRLEIVETQYYVKETQGAGKVKFKPWPARSRPAASTTTSSP